MIDDKFDETEDLPPPPPKQELDKPGLVIDVPPVDPSVMDDGEFDVGDIPPPPKPLENWKEAMAKLLTVEAGYAATFKDQVYSALLHHVRAKFLSGSSLGLAERADVDFAWKMRRQVKAKVGAIPGLIAGIIEYAD